MSTKQLLLVRHGRPDEGYAFNPGDPPLHAMRTPGTEILSIDHCSVTRAVGTSLDDVRVRTLNESTR